MFSTYTYVLPTPLMKSILSRYTVRPVNPSLCLFKRVLICFLISIGSLSTLYTNPSIHLEIDALPHACSPPSRTIGMTCERRKGGSVVITSLSQSASTILSILCGMPYPSLPSHTINTLGKCLAPQYKPSPDLHSPAYATGPRLFPSRFLIQPALPAADTIPYLGLGGYHMRKDYMGETTPDTSTFQANRSVGQLPSLLLFSALVGASTSTLHCTPTVYCSELSRAHA